MMLRFEWLKLMRAKRPHMALLAITFFLAMMLVGFYTYAQNETRGEAAFRYTFENASYFNGLTFALYAFYFGVLMIVPIFAAAEGGAQLAGERSGGTLPILLTRPVSRSHIFLSKWLPAQLSLIGLVAFLLLSSLLLGLVFVGWGDLALYPGVLQMTDRPQHMPQSQALLAFALAWPAASIALSAPLALSFFLSSWMRSAINAVATATAVYLVLYVISEIHFFRDLRPLLFTSYMGYWRALFRETIDWLALAQDAARLLSFTCLFLGLAHWRFRTREEA